MSPALLVFLLWFFQAPDPDALSDRAPALARQGEPAVSG